MSLPNRIAWPWPGDNPRVTQIGVRYCIAINDWEEKLVEFLKAVQGARRVAAAGVVDFSVNPLGSWARQLSTPGLYGAPPTIHGPEGSDVLVGESGALELAGWPTLGQRVEYFARALGCVAVVPSVDADASVVDGHLSLRLALPHNLYVLAHPDRPTRALEIYELRAVKRKDSGKECWAFYHWSVRDPAAPFLRILDETLKTDITQAVLGEGVVLEGEAYSWRYVDGSPFIPHTFYRLTASSFWGDEEARGLHRATFQAARQANTALYAADNAAWPTVAALDCKPLNARTAAPDGVNAVAYMDSLPGSVHRYERSEVEDASPQLLVLNNQVDPSASFRNVWTYVAQSLAAMGLSGAQVSRDTANPTSAAALSIHDSARRQAQHQAMPSFRRSDRELYAKSAALLSTLPGYPDVPELGYSTTYHVLPLTPDEEADLRADIDFRLAKGLMSHVDAYKALNPGADDEAAIAALERVQSLEARYRALAPASTPPTPPTSETPPTAA